MPIHPALREQGFLVEIAIQTAERPNAATRNVQLMAAELEALGYVTAEAQSMVLDEELTHAAEVLAAQEMAYATIPRAYRVQGYDLVDTHHQSLRQVFKGGIEHSEYELGNRVAGAEWELKRRRAELENLETIVGLPVGGVCIEISASPFDKPKHEQLAQHYNGLTMVRASVKSDTDSVVQYNYALPVTNPEFLQAIQTKLGRPRGEHILNSDELLQHPIVQTGDQHPELLARRIENLLGASLMETALGDSAVRMIKKAIHNRREAWEFANSQDQTDIHEELLASMIEAARLSPNGWNPAINAIRSGFWKELKDRFNGRHITSAQGGIINAAASRAVAAGDVFIACGSTVEATLSSQITRTQIINNLRTEVKGMGGCSACGAKGLLYGCGLCSSCNKKWCDAYALNGKQTAVNDLAYKNYARGSTAQQETWLDILRRDWLRTKKQVELKRKLQAEQEQGRAA
jgi:hypothetical protein